MEVIIYAICGVLIMAIGFALGIWVERSYKRRGCEYCTGEKTYGVLSLEPKDLRESLKINQLNAVTPHFCPMCGRNLKE